MLCYWESVEKEMLHIWDSVEKERHVVHLEQKINNVVRLVTFVLAEGPKSRSVTLRLLLLSAGAT